MPFELLSILREQHLAGLDRHDRDPVKLLGDVDSYGNCHRSLASFGAAVARPRSAVNALHNDRSQCLISGQNQGAGQAAKPPEPSKAAGMTAIPAPPASPDLSGRPGAHLKGRAA